MKSSSSTFQAEALKVVMHNVLLVQDFFFLEMVIVELFVCGRIVLAQNLS